ncbi:alpha/beta fold hydrolase [Deinococcus sp. HMF7620]|uniref:Alpha/beta fold hydrolase n=1 Tax=Deinococcus arboris TaxID=2682977 RepID=A0A7C9I0S0_9DEIO|nr:alpha/beta hydrolase [Deinococcus arboris]MVN88550.1 alpha/beta fold hydrolase [Deinococcus arboris]
MSAVRWVLLHGFGTSGTLWNEVAARLEAPTLCPDLPGFGTAAAIPGFSVAEMADHVQAALGQGPFLVAGHSMGAKVATELAARQPPGLRGLALVAPSPPGGEPMTDEDRTRLTAAWNDPAQLHALYGRITRRPLEASALADLLRGGQQASPHAWAAWPEQGSRENLRDRAAAVTVPTLILASRDDPAISLATIEEAVVPLYRAPRVQLLAGVGHLLPLEAPDEVAQKLKQWADEL